MHTPISKMEAAAEGLDSLAAHDATFASIVLDANYGSTLVLTILKDSPRVDFRLLAVQLAELSEKEFRSLQARYALAGHALKRSESGDGQVSYFSTRWGMTKELANRNEVEGFIDRLTGKGGHHHE